MNKTYLLSDANSKALLITPCKEYAAKAFWGSDYDLALEFAIVTEGNVWISAGQFNTQANEV